MQHNTSPFILWTRLCYTVIPNCQNTGDVFFSYLVVVMTFQVKMSTMLLRKKGKVGVGSDQQSHQSNFPVNVQQSFFETYSVPVPV